MCCAMKLNCAISVLLVDLYCQLEQYSFISQSLVFCFHTFFHLLLFNYYTIDPSGPPLQVNAVVLSSNEVLLSWIPPESEKQHGIIVQYSIVITDVYFNVSSRSIIVGVSSEHTLTELEEYALYTYQISAGNTAGFGPFSVAQNFTTLEAGINGVHFAN